MGPRNPQVLLSAADRSAMDIDTRTDHTGPAEAAAIAREWYSSTTPEHRAGACLEAVYGCNYRTSHPSRLCFEHRFEPPDRRRSTTRRTADVK